MKRFETRICPVCAEVDVMKVRALLRHAAEAVGLGKADQAKLLTAGSELARNILKYADGRGEMALELLDNGRRKGLRATFSDRGPGIANLALAMSDGYSSRGSLGIGLPGTQRLVDEFSIASRPGSGTIVTIAKWAP
jgi:serine/threonine-protein kinase RsbT